MWVNGSHFKDSMGSQGPKITIFWLKHCFSTSNEIVHKWVPQNPTEVNIGSGNGLVLSGNTPLLKPMLTRIYVAIWHHWAMMSKKFRSAKIFVFCSSVL